MRYRRIVKRFVYFAAVLCLLALAYMSYGKHRWQTLQRECEAAYKAARWIDVERAALGWFQWQPENAKPLIFAAEAASQQGQAMRSAIYLHQLPDGDKRTPAALLELSHLQFGVLNRPVAAAATCRRIISLEPQHREAHRRLAFYYAMSRQRDALIEETRRAIRVNADVPETYLYLLGADWITFTNGGELNGRWLQSAPGNETFLFAQAFHQFRSAAMAETSDEPNKPFFEQIMSDLQKRFPQNRDLLSWHLDIACLNGIQSEVTELLKRAPPNSIKDSRFWRYKGWVHEHRNELEEGRKAYLKALEIHPFDGQAYHSLAAIYRRDNDLKKVLESQEVSRLAQDIMRESLQIQSTSDIPMSLLRKMVKYAELCGENQVAARLAERLSENDTALSKK